MAHEDSMTNRSESSVYSKPEVLLGDLRGGLCSSGLCKQLRSVAADEIERLTRERDHFQACWNAVAGLRADRDVLEGENVELRSALDALYGARNLTDDNRISVLRRVLGVLNAPRPKVGDTR